MAKYVYSNGGVYEFENDQQVQEFSQRLGGDRVQQVGGGMWLFDDPEKAKQFAALQAQKPTEDKSVISEIPRAVGRAAIRGAMTFGDLVNSVTRLKPTMEKGVVPGLAPGEEYENLQLPSGSQFLIDKIQSLKKPPESPEGKMTEEVLTGAIGGATMPGGSLFARTLGGGMAGMGGEVAANTFEDKPVPRVIGALIGQLLSLPVTHGSRLLASAMGGPSVRTPGVVREHTARIPEREWSRAEEVMAGARENNIPLSPVQAFENQNPLHGLYERISATPGTSSGMAAFHSGQQVAGTSRARQFLDDIAGRTEPQVTVGRVQEQAANTLEKYRKLRTILTEDYYKPVREASQEEVRDIYRSLLRIAKDESLAENSEAAKAILAEARKLKVGGADTGPNPAAAVRGAAASVARPLEKDALLASIRDLENEPTKFVTNPQALQNLYLEAKAANRFGFSDSGLDRFVGGKIASALDEHEKVLNRLMPKRPEGNALYQEFTERIYSPKKAGPIGKIAGKTGFEEDKLPPASRIQSALLDEQNVGPQGIADAQRGLGFRFPQAVRMSLEKLFSKASTPEGGFTPATAASDFASAVAGGVDQTAKRENFRAIMRGVARSYGQNEDEIATGAERLMDALIATGRMRPRVPAEATGPHTTADILRMAGVGAGFHSTAYSAASRLVDRVFSGKSDQEIMKLLTSPDGLQELRRLGRIDPLRFRRGMAVGGAPAVINNATEEQQ